MKVKCIECETIQNSSDIKKGKIFILNHMTSNGFKYTYLERNIYYNNKIYILKITDKSHNPYFIKPKNLWQEQKLLWVYNKHWIQDKNNIMWLINIIIATILGIGLFK